MKNLLYIVGLVLILNNSWPLKAQEIQETYVLSLDEAFGLALKNNQSIQAQIKLTQIANNNVYPGKAGLLPSVNLLGDASYANNVSDIAIRTFQESPPEISFDESGVETRTLTAVIQADYIIFSGFSGKYRYKILQNEQSIALYQQESLINNTILTVAEIFLEIVKLQQREELLRENLFTSQKRLQKAQDLKEFGKSNGLLVLRAQTDVNQDENALDNLSLAKNNLLKDLNFLLGLEPNRTYKLGIDYTLPPLLSSEEIKRSILENNPDVKLSQNRVILSNNQLNLSQASRYPQVGTFANYGYFRQENDLQQLAEIKTLGFTLGVSLRYNLFKGNQNNRDIQNAKLGLESNKIRENQLLENLYTQAIKEQSNLQLLQDQLNREEENLITFEESFSRTESRYYAGKSSSLEVRDTQNALLASRINIQDLEIEILKASLRLESLKGTLVANSR